MTIGHVYFEYPEALPDCDIVRLYQVPRHPGRGWQCFERHTVHHDLTKQLEELFQQIRKGTRYEIRRAMERDNFVSNVVDRPTEKALDAFVRFYNQFAVQRGLGVNNRDSLQQLRERGGLTISWIGDEVHGDLAYHTYVVGPGMARLSHSVIRRPEGDEKLGPLLGRANRMLHWNDICHFKESGLGCYDFGGINPESDDPHVRRISEFKLGFGGEIATEYKCVRARTLKGRVALLGARAARRRSATA